MILVRRGYVSVISTKVPRLVRVQQQRCLCSYTLACTTTVCPFSYLYHIPIYPVPSLKCAVINLALLVRPLFGIVYIVLGVRIDLRPNNGGSATLWSSSSSERIQKRMRCRYGICCRKSCSTLSAYHSMKNEMCNIQFAT